MPNLIRLDSRNAVPFIALFFAGCASAIPLSQPLPSGAPTRPPAGYQVYCSNGADDWACGSRTTSVKLSQGVSSLQTAARPQSQNTPANLAVDQHFDPRFPYATGSKLEDLVSKSHQVAHEGLTMTPQLWALLTEINTRVNNRIRYSSDLDTHNQRDVWSTPLSDTAPWFAKGDCEDYALQKRQALRAEGLAPHAFSIAVALLPDLTWHAVLIVSTDQGDYVLDNRFDEVKPWSQIPYYWAAREYAGRIDDWRLITQGEY